MATTNEERLRRWRLVLGEVADESMGFGLTGDDAAIDAALAALYDGKGMARGSAAGTPKGTKGGSEASSPSVARWLGDIRSYFPTSIVQVMQRDAIERLNLKQLLLEREMLESVQPDVHLVATLIALKSVIPAKTRDTARQVVRAVVDDLMKRIANPTRQAILGSLNRAQRNRRPRHNEIDWNRTIKANLKHYQPEYKTIIPEIKIGFGRKRSSLRDIVLCIDQSGSMAASIVYSSVFGSVMASVPAVSTRMIVFDTSVVDLTEELNDPVDLLFGVQLGGGTDINRALTYCQGLITRPRETILVLISDLIEGGNQQPMLSRVASMIDSGVQVVSLLALSDEGAPCYDHGIAEQMAALGAPAFACTPDQFPELMAAAINRADIAQWAAQRGIVTARAGAARS